MKKTSILDIISPLFNRLNLLERGGSKLSLSNSAVFVCIIKIAIAPQISITEIGALLLSLLNYGHKRFESNKAQRAEIEAQAKVDQQHSKHLDAHSKAIKELQDKLQDQSKVVEEARSALVGQKLQASQNGRRQL